MSWSILVLLVSGSFVITPLEGVNSETGCKSILKQLKLEDHPQVKASACIRKSPQV